MTAPSPHTHPAERETPAGEAMREAVVFIERVLRDKLIAKSGCDSVMRPVAWTEGTEAATVVIASKLARLTAERDEAREDHVRAEAHICALEVLAYIHPDHTWKDAAVKERVARLAAEVALTTLRADHAAEVARKDAEIARLRTGVQAIIDGNYPSPRYCRPKPCPHGLHHWQECGECIDAALTQLIATTETTDA